MSRSAFARRGLWQTVRASPVAAAHAGIAAVLVAVLTLILVAPGTDDASGAAVGAPSPADIVAPRATRFESALLTERLRKQAADDVPVRFLEVDPAISRQQVARVRDILDLVDLYRREPLASAEEARAALSGAAELGSGWDLIERLLALDEQLWSTVKDETPRVVALAMRLPVRPDSLAAARNSSVAYVDRDVEPSTAALIAQLAARFIVPNSLIDETATEADREAARQAVDPVVREVAQGEMIVRAGEIIEPEQMEVLIALGLSGDQARGRDILASFLLVSLAVAAAAALLVNLRPATVVSGIRPVLLAAALVAAFTAIARFTVADEVVLIYAFPAPAIAMTVTALFGLELGLAAALVLAIALGAIGGQQLEIVLYVLFGSLAGASLLGNVERIKAFFWAGGALGASNLALLAAFEAPRATLDMRGAIELAGAAATNAVFSTGLAALGILAAGALFGVLTSLQLLELARPDHPLLRMLQLHAPGTYQHSIVLSNLGERAAQAIGADPLLVRIGSYFHDVGKIRQPHFFIENQLGNEDPHSELPPETSAAIIIDHVTGGLELATEYRLPDAIKAFIAQHHGTLRVEFFYRQAVGAEGTKGDLGSSVDEAAYRYPGPIPRTRETAIVMLADGAEAAVRSASPETRAAIEPIVRGIIDARLAAGQLDDADLTLRDLRLIQDAFVTTLESMYHPRIAYPAGEPDIRPRGGDGRPTSASDGGVQGAVGSEAGPSPKTESASAARTVPGEPVGTSG